MIPVLPSATFEPWDGNSYTGNNVRTLKSIVFLCQAVFIPYCCCKQIITNLVA